jgi:hypothetical protein
MLFGSATLEKAHTGSRALICNARTAARAMSSLSQIAVPTSQLHPTPHVRQSPYVSHPIISYTKVSLTVPGINSRAWRRDLHSRLHISRTHWLTSRTEDYHQVTRPRGQHMSNWCATRLAPAFSRIASFRRELSASYSPIARLYRIGTPTACPALQFICDLPISAVRYMETVRASLYGLVKVGYLPRASRQRVRTG